MNTDNLIFFLILAGIAILFLYAIFFVIYKIFKFVIKILFKKSKEEDAQTKVKELEKSEEKGHKFFGVLGPKIQSEIKKIETPSINEKKVFDKKEEMDIKEGLESLKISARVGSAKEESGIFEKIKVPRPKKSDSAQAPSAKAAELEQKPTEIIKKAEIKIPVEKNQVAPQDREKKPFMFNEKSEINRERNRERNILEKDNTIYGGKDALDRRILKFKLGFAKGDSLKEMLKIQRGLGLRITREERAKLIEKYFPKYYGQQISKSEIKKQIKVVERSPIKSAGERIQRNKEIKFLKKISGIK